MDAYILLQHAEHSLDTLSHKANDFLQKCNKELTSLDLTKIEVFNPTEVRDKLMELKELARQLNNVISATLQSRQYLHGTMPGSSSSSYVHGRIGQLRGKYKPLQEKLSGLAGHLDVLISAAASNHTDAHTVTAITSLSDDVIPDLIKKFPDEAAYIQTINVVVVMVALMHLILKKLR